MDYNPWKNLAQKSIGTKPNINSRKVEKTFRRLDKPFRINMRLKKIKVRPGLWVNHVKWFTAFL